MNTSVVRIMWKEIAIILIVLYMLRNLLDVYIIIKYKKIVKMYGKIENEVLKRESIKHLKLCKKFAIGPLNKQIYLVYNGLCWLLASLSFEENKLSQFLEYLDMVRQEKKFELKPFVLSLYYRSINDLNMARKYYEIFMKCSQQDQHMYTILNSIYVKKDKDNLQQAIKSFENPTIVKLLKENKLI